MSEIQIAPYSQDGKLALVSPYSAPILAACKAIPGLKWASDRKAWVGYPDAIASALELMRGKVRWDLPRSPLLATFDKNVSSRTSGKGLRNYQHVGVDWLLSCRAGILADDMGLGKSAQVLTAARLAGGKLPKVVVVCPAYVKSVWADPKDGQIARWWPSAFVTVLEGGSADTDAAPGLETDIVVVNYDILHAWVDLLTAWGSSSGGLTVIFDEAQYLTGDSSRRTKAARQLRKGAARVWALTGTPMPNYVRDLWPLLETLSPGRFGSFFAFGLRYCDGHKEEIPAIEKTVWNFQGRSHEAELSQRLCYLMLRRTKDEVALELPDKLRRVTWLDGPGRGGPVGRTLDETMTALSDAKVGAAVEAASRAVEAGQGPVIIGCWRQEIARWIVEGLTGMGIPAEIITGGLSAKVRADRIARVRSSTRGVLVVTVDSCATGIDLTWASVGIVAELLYDPRKLLQFESRLHRPGARGAVSFEYLALRQSIDEVIISRVVSKLDTWEAVIGKGAGSEALAGTFVGGGLSEAEIMSEIMAGIGG